MEISTNWAEMQRKLRQHSVQFRKPTERAAATGEEHGMRI